MDSIAFEENVQKQDGDFRELNRHALALSALVVGFLSLDSKNLSFNQA